MTGRVQERQGDNVQKNRRSKLVPNNAKQVVLELNERDLYPTMNVELLKDEDVLFGSYN